MTGLKLIVIGGSSGSFEALNAILPALSANPPSPPVLVVMHLPPDRPSAVSRLFAARCAIEIREAEDKDDLKRATLYFAPPNYHLLVNREGWLSLSIDPPLNYCRPSIDILFESASTAFGSGVLGIILSGANHDGAAGLASIFAKDGRTVVQDPRCSLSSEMPAAALKRCPGASTMNLAEIAELLRHCRAT